MSISSAAFTQDPALPYVRCRVAGSGRAQKKNLGLERLDPGGAEWWIDGWRKIYARFITSFQKCPGGDSVPQVLHVALLGVVFPCVVKHRVDSSFFKRDLHVHID